MEKLGLREIQLAELEILKLFDRICREHNLRYTLAYGTLLGAVRHKGFIPWDDDIDVCMPRPDYEKFIEVFDGSEKPDDIVLARDRGEGAVYPFVKIIDKRYSIEYDGYGGIEHIWIDVFPVDGITGDVKKAKKAMDKSAFYRHIIVVNKWTGVKAYRGSKSRFLFALARVYAKLYGEKRAIKNMRRFAMRIPFGSSEYAATIIWGEGVKERMPARRYEELCEIEFEGAKFFATADYDGYLTDIYGDYMKLPPESERKTHEINVYRNDTENG